jgi:hypothetical protein
MTVAKLQEPVATKISHRQKLRQKLSIQRVLTSGSVSQLLVELLSGPGL